MATLSSSISALHRDNRSEAKPFKRDKEHSSKWAFGTRGDNIYTTCIYNDVLDPKPLPHNFKIKPTKKYSDQTRTPKSHGNSHGNAQNMGRAKNRLARTFDAQHESSTTSTMSKSLLDLLPSPAPKFQSSVDEGITYSFDAPSGPLKKVGLDSLVDKAEKAWAEKETEKIIKKEYEVLDGAGETTVLKKGKRSPKTKPSQIDLEEDDWEKI